MSSALHPARPKGPLHAPQSATRWWVAAALVALTGLGAGAAWASAGLLTLADRPSAFTRAGVPGSVAVELVAGQRAVVYVEAGTPAAARSAKVEVSGPDGTNVTTHRYLRLVEYDVNQEYDVTTVCGRLGYAVESFQAPDAGSYTVTAAAPTMDPALTLAVGEDLADGAVRAVLAPSLFALGMLALAAVLGATPVVRSRPAAASP